MMVMVIDRRGIGFSVYRPVLTGRVEPLHTGISKQYNRR